MHFYYRYFTAISREVAILFSSLEHKMETVQMFYAIFPILRILNVNTAIFPHVKYFLQSQFNVQKKL